MQTPTKLLQLAEAFAVSDPALSSPSTLGYALQELLEESLALSASLAQEQQVATEPPSVLSPSRFLQLASQPTEELYNFAESVPVSILHFCQPAPSEEVGEE